jgi:hypothetical protein
MSLMQFAKGEYNSLIWKPDDVTPKGWDPAARELEEKAFALAGEVTPMMLLQANAALQQEYKDKAGTDPGNPLYTEMMIKTQNALMRQVKDTDYTAVNARHGATLTPQDRQDIAFVQKTPITASAKDNALTLTAATKPMV